MLHPIQHELARVEGGTMEWNNVFVVNLFPHDSLVVEQL